MNKFSHSVDHVFLYSLTKKENHMNNRSRQSRGNRYENFRDDNRDYRGIEEGYGYQSSNRGFYQGDQYSGRNPSNTYSDRNRSDRDYPRQSYMNDDRSYRQDYNRQDRNRSDFGSDREQYRGSTYSQQGGRHYSDEDQFHFDRNYSRRDQPERYYGGGSLSRDDQYSNQDMDYRNQRNRDNSYRARENEFDQNRRYMEDEDYSDQEHSSFGRSSQY
jgi:hypothetical protein